jgi:predicted TIM-barrel fold metal-dependent hydrolase
MMSPEHILFGSDYPHPEGMAEPLKWAAEMSDLFPPADIEKMMGANLYGLLGVTPSSST